MKFKGKKIWVYKDDSSFAHIFENSSWLWVVVKCLIFFVWLWLMIYLSSFAFVFGKKAIKAVSTFSVKVVSTSFWKEMEKDELWQINVLIAWYWWETHQWWFLSDTMMIASFNPKLWTVTFLSVPRDLYVKYSKWSFWRINWVFADSYYNSKSLDSAANVLWKKLTQITWIPINYYALVDFQWFKDLIDSLGGVDVNVPYDLVDSQYPTPDWGYTTFKVSQGMNHFDWETALKYARSRHSTSDFSRALRQQQIIQSIMDKVLNGWNLTNIDKVKSLYAQYNSMVHTNISLKEMIWMAKYIDIPKKFFSYVYSSDCNLLSFRVTEPWCFLYYAPRDRFWWASVVLPSWATPDSLEHYKKMQDFAFFVVYNQKFLLENAKIKILDWMDKKLKKKTKVWWSAQQLAIELKKYWFNIIETWTAPKVYEKTVLYKNGTWDVTSTTDLLKVFTSIPEVLTWEDTYLNDITLVLGNDFSLNKF